MNSSFEFRSLECKKNQEGCKCDQQNDHCDLLSGRQIFAVFHGEQVSDQLQVCKVKRCNTGGKYASVDNTKQHPEYGYHNADQCTMLEQIYDEQRCKNQQCIIKECQRWADTETYCWCKGMSGYTFNCKDQDAGQQSVEQQWKFIQKLYFWIVRQIRKFKVFQKTEKTMSFSFDIITDDDRFFFPIFSKWFHINSFSQNVVSKVQTLLLS